MHQEKIAKRANIIEEVLVLGHIQHKPLEKLIGKLVYAQTSVFGRFGRAMLKPLYTKLRAHPYTEVISPCEAGVPEWWAASIRSSVPRAVELHPTTPDVIIYTDAATSTRILAAVAIEPSTYSALGSFSALLSEVADPVWETIFCETTLIYGLELLAVVATIFALKDFLRGKNVTFYVDNPNTKDAMVKGFSLTKVINILIQIFWAFAQSSGARFWFEQVPSNRNIADLPTRLEKLPAKTEFSSSFPILDILRKWVTETHKKGFFLFTNGPTAGNQTSCSPEAWELFH